MVQSIYLLTEMFVNSGSRQPSHFILFDEENFEFTNMEHFLVMFKSSEISAK